MLVPYRLLDPQSLDAAILGRYVDHVLKEHPGPRRNKDGSEFRYLQLAHNVRDLQKRRSAVQVVYNFGCEDAVSRGAHPHPGHP